ncbi:MAG: ISKra4 family transposase, partial [Acaryochloris sp. RU_4_1]|nr:ISKra4 family transposase [Acaryochloris sp. RU_4_1]
RRLVARLGDIDQFIPLLQLEAHKQDFESAPTLIWLSDGGRGFWRVYRTLFSHCAVAPLDFFHAAGQLARATQAMFGDSRSAQAQGWFRRWRHPLRHGQHLQVLCALTVLIHSQLFTSKSFTTLLQVQAYFQRHHRHIRYRHFEQQQIPLGSGMVESACKCLVQQRFKGVGMRWSEDGFNHLLILRVAWVNERFDSLFPDVTIPKTMASPIR